VGTYTLIGVCHYPVKCFSEVLQFEVSLNVILDHSLLHLLVTTLSAKLQVLTLLQQLFVYNTHPHQDVLNSILMIVCFLFLIYIQHGACLYNRLNSFY